MALGTIKFFNIEKDFGFIVPDDDGPDVFLHGSEVVESPLKTGERVSFDAKQGFGNLKATNVRRVDQAEPTTIEPPI